MPSAVTRVHGGDTVFQIVERDFLFGDGGDIGHIHLAAGGRVVATLHHPDREPECREHRPLPLDVALGRVVVEGPMWTACPIPAASADGQTGSQANTS